MRSRRSAVGRLLALLLGVAWGLWGTGCGEGPEPGGRGSLDHGTPGPAAVGPPDLLVLEGSPYEMGWRQGSLLRDRIRATHGAWRAGLLESLLPGGGRGAGGEALRAALDAHVDLCLDQCQHRLSERMLQELEGLAAGCGLGTQDLLRLEVMRDALRMKGLGPRLVGAAGLAPRPTGYEARVRWGGPDARAHGRDWLVIVRRPTTGRARAVVAWPGSLGGLAGLRDDGLGFLSAGGRVTDPRRKGFGGGRPFSIAVLEALDEADGLGALVAQVTGTMGHALLAFAPAGGTNRLGAQAMAGFQVYGGADPPWVLGDAPFIAIGPYESPGTGEARALQQDVGRAGLGDEERWLALERHVDPDGDTPPRGPWATLRWEDGVGTLRFAATADGPVRTVRLGSP